MNYMLIVTLISIVITLILCSLPFIMWAIKSSKARKMRSGYKKLKIGISARELLDLLGPPDSVGMVDAETKIMRWRNDEGIMHGIFDKDTTRTVKAYVRNGIVISFDGTNINKRTW